MNWRRKQKDEIDHELLWLSVSSITFFCGLFWLKLGFAWPVCFFHEITRYPCFTCGGTRCLLALSSGHITRAFLWNPLVCSGVIGFLIFDLYAVVVLLFNLPRLRFDRISSGSATKLRLLAVAAAIANWIYLVKAGV